jgi:predicted nucleic acid-binding protein
MTRYVIDPEIALELAARDARVPDRHRLVAPTLLRSQVLALLYADVRAGTLARAEASRRLDYLRGLQMRLLGDRVLQRRAWDVAAELGWPDTYAAEYIALTMLQADALVTENAELARAARRFVAVASIRELLA